jgi:fatty acid amide hydrolase 2
MWLDTYNHVYGRTRNPYDLNRSAGGSSGGEGAIVAAAASPFGIGADIGGSVRYPSAWNGVPGHKHTATMLPGTGHWPPALGPLAGYNTYGPICRRVEDLAYILPLLAGPDGKDTIVEERELKSPDSVDLSKLKVFFMDNNGQVSPNAEVKRAVSMAAGALAAEKIPVEHWRPEGLEHSLDIWAAGMAQNPEPFAEVLAGDEDMPMGREFLKFLLRQSKLTLPAISFALIEKPGRILEFRQRSYPSITTRRAFRCRCR